MKKANTPTLRLLPAGVEVASRQKADTEIVFVLNCTDGPQTLSLGQASTNALTGKPEPALLEVPAFDVKILAASYVR